MSKKVIGIKNNNRVVVAAATSSSHIVGCTDVYCNNLSIGIRDRSSNVRYIKQSSIPVEFDIDLENDICEATEKVLKIFNDTMEEYSGNGCRLAVMLPVILSKMSTICDAASGVDKMREGFMALIETATAITEPILWFYALTACILMATGKKGVGWDKLKNVGYSYILITMLPTLFQFCRWISKTLIECIAIG